MTNHRRRSLVGPRRSAVPLGDAYAFSDDEDSAPMAGHAFEGSPEASVSSQVVFEASPEKESGSGGGGGRVRFESSSSSSSASNLAAIDLPTSSMVIEASESYPQATFEDSQPTQDACFDEITNFDSPNPEKELEIDNTSEKDSVEGFTDSDDEHELTRQAVRCAEALEAEERTEASKRRFEATQRMLPSLMVFGRINTTVLADIYELEDENTIFRAPRLDDVNSENVEDYIQNRLCAEGVSMETLTQRVRADAGEVEVEDEPTQATPEVEDTTKSYWTIIQSQKTVKNVNPDVDEDLENSGTDSASDNDDVESTHSDVDLLIGLDDFDENYDHENYLQVSGYVSDEGKPLVEIPDDGKIRDVDCLPVRGLFAASDEDPEAIERKVEEWDAEADAGEAEIIVADNDSEIDAPWREIELAYRIEDVCHLKLVDGPTVVLEGATRIDAQAPIRFHPDSGLLCDDVGDGLGTYWLFPSFQQKSDEFDDANDETMDSSTPASASTSTSVQVLSIDD